MKNYIQPGKVITLTAPSGGVTSGEGYISNGLLVVAAHDADENDSYEAWCEGVFEMDKDTDGSPDFDPGEEIFWDDTNKEWNDTATGYYPAGTAWETAGTSDAKCKVKLKGFSVTAAA